MKSALAAALKVHPIEVVFAGHEHFYERGEIDGLKYFVLGGGGAPLEDPDEGFPGVQAARKALSYATVEVCGCHARGVVKDIAGKVIDSFRIAACATPCGAPGVPVTASSIALAPLTLAESPDGGVPDGGSRRKQRRQRRSRDGGTDARP